MTVGFPVSASATAALADGTAFLLVCGGGGPSRTGVKNGYVIYKVSESVPQLSFFLTCFG